MSSPAPTQFGRYEAHEEIGDGAMGRVHRGYDPLVRRPVAIKTVKAEYLTRDTRDEYLRRFRREAQAAGMLSHPGIVSIFDVAEDYIVMEFVEGVSLADLLKHRGTLDLPEALRLLGPVADAIDFAHRSGVIHRDIKPANIMVQPDGRPKLMDFGVARIETSAITSGGHFFGSPSYMAPEQILGGEMSLRADLFSFAVVAYETVTGQRPFQGEGISTIVYRVVHSAPEPPSKWNENLPEYYDAVFRKALCKDPAQRFPTAGALMAALTGSDLEALLISIPPEVPEAPKAAARPSAEVETQALRTAPPRPLSRTAWLGGGAAAVALATVATVPLMRKLVAVPPPAPPPPIEVVSLRIETEPPGAAVTVNGTLLGDAPVSRPQLTPGVHRVSVTREGYVPAELSLRVTPGLVPPPLRFVMTPLPTPAPNPAPRAEPKARRAARAPDSRPAPQGGTPVPAALPAQRTLRGEPTVPGAGAVYDVERDPTITPPRRKAGRDVRYPEAAHRVRFGGTVTVEMVVTEEGEPTQLRVLQSAGEVLDRAVMDAARSWRFEPARKNGRPVRVRWRWHTVFDPTA